MDDAAAAAAPALAAPKPSSKIMALQAAEFARKEEVRFEFAHTHAQAALVP